MENGPHRKKPTDRDVRRRTHSQNFIADAELARELVSLAEVQAADLVVEPGAGRGVLTEHLSHSAHRVIALEIDPAWVLHLQRTFTSVPNVDVLSIDALRFRLPAEPFRVFGNIPFGITTQLFHHLFDHPGHLWRADLIVQREVARKRSAILPSNVLNLYWQPWFSFRITRRIPATAFRPIPRVDAALLTVSRSPSPLVDPRLRAAYVDFVRNGFAKGGLLRAGLRRQFTKSQVRALRRAVPFTDDTRASSLDVQAWATLFEASRLFGSAGLSRTPRAAREATGGYSPARRTRSPTRPNRRRD